MSFFSSSLLVAIFLLALWLVTWHRHWAMKAMEQVQVEASLYSVCHQTAGHLNSELKNSNDLIFTTRVTMSSIASGCIAAAAASTIKFAAIMSKCNRSLLPLAMIGSAAEKAQVAALHGALPAVNWLRLESMIKKNRLDLKQFSEITVLKAGPLAGFSKAHPKANGFKRQTLNPYEQMLEESIAAFGGRVEWPEDLVADDDLSQEKVLSNGRTKSKFEAEYSYALDYRPKVLGFEQKNILSRLQKKFLQSRSSSQARSQSLCFLKEVEAGRKYKVQLDAEL